MLATARENAAARGVTNVEFRQVDGEALDVPAGAFDVVTMRWGLMFMPDPVACLAGARAALKPGGRIVLSCWGAPPRNPWASIPLGVLAKHVEIPAPPPGAPGLFAFADGARLRATLEEAGFSDVALQEVEVDMSDFATGEEFVKYVFDLAGPIAMHYARVPEAKQPQVASEIAREAEQAGGGGARLKGVTWVATAHA
jgi:ubiquinone/menaquinone biosynthesis C-methylase UbiE